MKPSLALSQVFGNLLGPLKIKDCGGSDIVIENVEDGCLTVLLLEVATSNSTGEISTMGLQQPRVVY